MAVLGKNEKGKYTLPMLVTAAAVVVYLFVIAFFVWRQVQIEKLGIDASGSEMHEAVAVLENVRGRVFVMSHGSVQRRLAAESSEIFPGDEIQTTDDSSVGIRFDEKTMVGLGSNSLLMVHDEITLRDTVVELSSGEVDVDSTGSNPDRTVVLKTPGASIRLKIKKSVLFRAEDFQLKTTPMMDFAQYEKDIAESYIDLIQNVERAKQTPAMEALAGRAEEVCGRRDVHSCLKARDALWSEIIANLDGTEPMRLKMKVAVTPDRKETIVVEKGAVSIETNTRVLSVAQGDSPLELEPGKVATRKTMTEKSEQNMIEEPEELYFNVETIIW